MELSELVGYLDEYLAIDEVPDSSRALNGLQVENGGEVTRIAAAVDASEASIREAIDRDCDLLLVHHGLFWSGNRPVTGRRYRRIKPLLDHGVAVYGAHVPLDVHAEVGNNAVLAREIELEVEGRFADYKGTLLGVHGRLSLRREALAARLDETLNGRVLLVPGGPERVERVGVITGAGASMIDQATEIGLDALVTGEGAHHTYFDATEGGINVFYGGHYATETWGVKALAEHIEDRYGLPWTFLDFPTGL